jgi:hypothetical protein
LDAQARTVTAARGGMRALPLARIETLKFALAAVEVAVAGHAC